jgi:pyruvate/2-oxoglutarate dehydrogenase complex dihydrolipoamide dehydrogenase (E3) component
MTKSSCLQICVERRGALGGTCLNVGCIPSKVRCEALKKLPGGPLPGTLVVFNIQVRLLMSRISTISDDANDSDSPPALS